MRRQDISGAEVVSVILSTSVPVNDVGITCSWASWGLGRFLSKKTADADRIYLGHCIQPVTNNSYLLLTWACVCMCMQMHVQETEKEKDECTCRHSPAREASFIGIKSLLWKVTFFLCKLIQFIKIACCHDLIFWCCIIHNFHIMKVTLFLEVFELAQNLAIFRERLLILIPTEMVRVVF